MNRGLDAWPELPDYTAPPATYEQLFRRKCFLLGITEPVTVARLWTIERERLKQADQAGGKRK